MNQYDEYAQMMNGAQSNGIINGVPNLQDNSITEANLISGLPSVTKYNDNLQSVDITEYEDITETQEESVILTNSYNVGNGQTHEAFAPVKKMQTQYDDRRKSVCHNVNMLVNGKWEEVGSGVSPNYLVISNKELNAYCERIRRGTGMKWVHDRMMFDGKRYKNVYRTEDNGIHVPELNDTMYIIFTEVNSYDGSGMAGFRIDFMVLSCLNGMISPRYGLEHKIRHSLQKVNWKEDITNANRLLTGERCNNRLKEFSTALKGLHKPVGLEDLAMIRNKYINKLNPLRYGEILTNFHKKDGKTAWDLCQAGTDNFWHRKKRNLKVTKADFDNNGEFVDGMIEFANATA